MSERSRRDTEEIDFDYARAVESRWAHLNKVDETPRPVVSRAMDLVEDVVGVTAGVIALVVLFCAGLLGLTTKG